MIFMVFLLCVCVCVCELIMNINGTIYKVVDSRIRQIILIDVHK